jgi:hypothetical protein
LPNVSGVFARTTFRPPDQANKSRACARAPIAFSDEPSTFECTRKGLETALLTVAIYAAAKQLSSLIVFVNIAARICPRNHVIEGKFLLTVKPGFGIQALKTGAQLHMQEARKFGRPFSDSRRRINMEVLREFAKKSGAGQVTLGERKPSFQTFPPDWPKGGKANELALPEAAPAKSRSTAASAASIPRVPESTIGAAGAMAAVGAIVGAAERPAFAPPQLLLQSIETAIATALAEMCHLFRGYEFLAEGLKFFRVANRRPFNL